MDYNIRYFDSKDYDSLLKLLVETGLYYDFIDNKTSLLQKSEDKPGSIIVCERDGEIIGCCYIVYDYSIQYILHLGVHPTFQKMGIGKEIMEFVENEIRHYKNDASPILWVDADNQEGQAFWKKLGWKPVDNRKYMLFSKKI